MKIYEQIWRSDMEENYEKTEDERLILGEIIKRQDEIMAKVGSELAEIFDEYNDLQLELSALYERSAFFRGVRLAMKFVFESMLD